MHDPRHISAGFAKRRHSLILFDALRPRIVCSQGLDQIEVVSFQKFAQIAASARDIRLRIESVVHAQLIGRAGHQLHQAARALCRNCVRIEPALRMNHAIHQVGIEMIRGAGRIHHVIERGHRLYRSRIGRNKVYRNRLGGRGRRHGQRQVFFKPGNVGRRNVGKTGIVRRQKKTSRRSRHQAMFMPDAEAVAKNRQLGGASVIRETNCGNKNDKSRNSPPGFPSCCPVPLVV